MLLQDDLIHKWQVEEIRDDGTIIDHGRFGGHEIDFIDSDRVECFFYYCDSEEDVDNGISHRKSVIFPSCRLRLTLIRKYH